MCEPVLSHQKDRAGLKLQNPSNRSPRKRRAVASAAPAAIAVAVQEALESRQLLASVGMVGDTLLMMGDRNASNELSAWVEGSHVVAKAQDVTRRYALAGVDKIQVMGGNRADKLWIDPKLTKAVLAWMSHGNDTVHGGAGNDSINGGEGDDALHGMGGNDSLYGGGGRDTLYGGAGSNTLNGGNGHDMLYYNSDGASAGRPGNVVEPLENRQLLASVGLSSGVLTINGDASAANNVSVTLSGSSIVAKANGVSKTYSASSVSSIRINGGDKADKLVVASNVTKGAKVYGKSGNDTIVGGAGKDTLIGGGGADLMQGFGGNDTLWGEGGKDTLYGGAGTDVLDGGPDTDLTYQDTNGPSTSTGGSTSGGSSTPGVSTGGSTSGSTSGGSTATASVSLSGGVLTVNGHATSSNTINISVSGSSFVVNANGTTKSYSSSSVSSIRINGGSAADRITVAKTITKKVTAYGKAGNDTIQTGAGNDLIYGGDGNDLLQGFGGNDTLRGENGTDTLYGGTGDDNHDGGPGDDLNYRDSDGPTTGGSTGGSTGGGSTPSTSNGASPNAVITATTSRSIQAGMGFHAHATNSSLGEGTPTTARYQWDFGDPGSKYNTLAGFNAAHVYEDPGTYTVKLTITNEDGKVDTTTTTVNVASSTRRKIYVSAGGSDSNDGSSTSRAVKTFARAKSLLGGSSNAEVLFRRGDTFTMTSGILVTGDNVLIGAYGSGSRPVLKYMNGFTYEGIIGNNRYSENVTVRDLTFDSKHTSGTDENGVVVGVKPGGRNVSVLDSVFYNLGFAINANSEPVGVLVQDNDAPSSTALKGYFAWAEGSDHVYLGNASANVYAHTLRTGGDDGTGGFERLLVAHNNFANPVDSNGTIRGTLTLHEGKYYYVANNTLSKGKVTYGPLGEGDGLHSKAGRVQHGVIENNTINSIMIVEHGGERLMIRNNVINSSGTFGIQIEGYNSTYGRGVRDVTIANNTVVNTSSRGQFLHSSDGATGLRVANNLYVAPNLVTGSYMSASVAHQAPDLSEYTYFGNNVWADPDKLGYAEGGVNYVYRDWPTPAGYRTPSEWNAFGQVATDYFSKTSVSNGHVPSSSSLAANAARKFAGVFTDKNGKIRSGDVWSAGAVEV